MGKRHLLIGCGSAALRAVTGIREVSKEDEIKLVTRENLMPYSPTALPGLLNNQIDEAHLWLKDEAFFQETGSSFVREKEVVKVNTIEKKIVYKDGTDESYDALLIATGSHPFVPEIEGLDETGFITFHCFEDYLKLKQQLKSGGNVVIFGGGLVAVELAIPLLEAGYGVDLVIRSRMLRRYFNPDIGDRMESILMERGAKIHKGCTIEHVRRQGTGVEARLSGGQTLFSDVDIVLALGVQPSISFLEGSGVTTGEGIIVDDRMRTNVEGVFAAGDVAEASEFFTGRPGINAILPAAVHQGKIAGMNMAGADSVYKGWMSMNMFNFFGHVACSVGISKTGDAQVIKDYDAQKETFKELWFQEDKLVGATFLDVKVDPGVFVYLIENRVDVGAYKKLLLNKPKETSRWLMLQAEKKQTEL